MKREHEMGKCTDCGKEIPEQIYANKEAWEFKPYTE